MNQILAGSFIIESYYPLWAECSEQPETLLLRLCLLRGLIRKLHAEKSKYLARGLKKECLDIKEWERKLSELKDASSLQFDLPALDEHIESPGFKKKKRLLPEAFFRVFERQKFDRYDREWEAAMASEAIQAGWRFWSLKAWVKIDQVEGWEQRLSDRLWPHGAILFAESGTLLNSYWEGTWTLVLHPKYKHPEELLLHFDPNPKVPQETEAKPYSWKLLF